MVFLFLDLIRELDHKDEATLRLVNCFKKSYGVLVSTSNESAENSFDSKSIEVNVYWANTDTRFCISIPGHNDTKTEESSNLTVSSRGIPPMSIVRFPSMFQWSISSGQALTAKHSQDGGVENSYILQDFAASTDEPPCDITTYIPIFSQQVVSKDIITSAKKLLQPDTVHKSSKSNLITGVIEYTERNEFTKLRSNCLKAEFENILFLLGCEAPGLSSGFTSDGNHPPNSDISTSNIIMSPSGGEKSEYSVPNLASNPSERFSFAVETMRLLSVSARFQGKSPATRIDALCDHIGNIAAGLLRGNSAVFLLPLNGENGPRDQCDTTCRLWAYDPARKSVRYVSV